MLSQIDVESPIPIRLLFRAVPGKVILSIFCTPDSESDLGVAMAGHIGHLDSQDIVILHCCHNMVLLGPTGLIHCATAVVALRDFCLCANAVICAGRVVGELVGHIFLYINRYCIDDIFAVISVDRVSPYILVEAHRNFDNPSSVILFLALNPANIILPIMLTPNSHFTICIPVIAQRAQHHSDYAIFRINTTLNEPVHTSVFIEVTPSIA